MGIEKKMVNVVHCWLTVENDPLHSMGMGRELNSVTENDAILTVLSLVDKSRNKVSSINRNMDIL